MNIERVAYLVKSLRESGNALMLMSFAAILIVLSQSFPSIAITTMFFGGVLSIVAALLKKFVIEPAEKKA